MTPKTSPRMSPACGGDGGDGEGGGKNIGDGGARYGEERGNNTSGDRGDGGPAAAEHT